MLFRSCTRRIANNIQDNFFYLLNVCSTLGTAQARDAHHLPDASKSLGYRTAAASLTPSVPTPTRPTQLALFSGTFPGVPLSPTTLFNCLWNQHSPG